MGDPGFIERALLDCWEAAGGDTGCEGEGGDEGLARASYIHRLSILLRRQATQERLD